MEKKKRQATYTVTVPIKFTVVGDNDLDCKQLLDWAVEQAYQRLENGYFDVVEKDVEIVDKKTHYTRQELEAQDRAWRLFLAEARGVR